METPNNPAVIKRAQRYLAVTAPRQNLRLALMLVWVILMPLNLYYFSPYLPFLGLAEGLICGSVLVFAAMFVSSLVFGRVFCAWLCPAGAVQDFALIARPKLVKRRALQWIKFGLWAPWIGAWVGLAVSAAGLRSDGLRPDFFFRLENGVSVSRPEAYIIYLSVLTLILGLSFALGRRGFCHTSCWMAPFMVVGQQLGKLIRLPGLLIRSDANRCTACGTCSVACPMSLDIGGMARNTTRKSVSNKQIPISHHDCIFCMRCADACPSQVLKAGFGMRH